MFLLVGLGNPGKDYENTRHNIGFKAVDEVIRRFSFADIGTKFHSQCFSGQIAGQKIVALKPQTFMNRSGQAVGEAARFYKVAPEHVIVIHDDLDIVAGRIKAKIGGGSGGQNGIKDTDRHLGVQYRRIRIGIGHPGDKHQVSSYVLKPFAKQEWEAIEPLLSLIAESMEAALDESFPASFTNAIGMKLNPQHQERTHKSE